MAKVKLGIIGVGNMGTGHSKNYLDGLMPEIEITAVADRNPARRVAREKAAARTDTPSLTFSPMLGTRCAGFALTARF